MSIPILDTTDFRLGLFSSNCSGGLAVTTIPERWSASWEDNLRLGRLADEVGIDFMLPIARWIGYGGSTNFHEGVLEPIPWAAGLLSNTTTAQRLHDDPHGFQPPRRHREAAGHHRPDGPGPHRPQRRRGLE